MSIGRPRLRCLRLSEEAQRFLMILLLAVSVLGCGQKIVGSPPDTTAAPSPSTPTSLVASTPSTTTAALTTTTDTLGIEFQRLAEAHGITAEQARDILFAQARQADGLIELERLVAPNLIVEAAFHPDFEQADEVTVYVIDREAVPAVSERIVEAGLDPAKTTVEVFVDDAVDPEEEFLQRAPFNQYE